MLGCRERVDVATRRLPTEAIAAPSTPAQRRCRTGTSITAPSPSSLMAFPEVTTLREDVETFGRKAQWRSARLEVDRAPRLHINALSITPTACA